jgi:hypothetical protein
MFTGIRPHGWGWALSFAAGNQAAEVPSSKVTDKVPRGPAMNSRIVAAFVSRMHSMISFPELSMTATEIVAW